MKSGPRARAVVVALLMIASVAAASALRPRAIPAVNAIDLAATIPAAFGDWREDPSILPVVPEPNAQAELERIYSQTIARSYVASDGRQVMLSIAYGAAQSDSLRLHEPKVCYRAQGFAVVEPFKATLKTLAGDLPVMRFVARKSLRNEPVTYWMVIGGRLVQSGWDAKLVRLHFALSGVVPDGFLVRVSSIDNDNDGAFEVEQRFVDDLLKALDGAARARIFGQPAG